MSANQKPTRDTGADMDAVEARFKKARREAHERYDEEPSRDSGEEVPCAKGDDCPECNPKPAPKAPAQALNEYMKHLEANGERVDEAPKAPVRE